VRYLMADVLLGGDKEYYRQFLDDANSIEALRRLDGGIQITNLSDFERKMVPGKNIRVVKKGTLTDTNGTDLKLSTDPIFIEPEIRSFMLELNLGKTKSKVCHEKNIQFAEALRRDSVGVKILNLDDIRKDKGQVAKKIVLSSDVDYDEDLVCYMLADMCLGGPAGFYAEIFDMWRDPNAGEAVRRWNEGIRIKNILEFDRVKLSGKGTKIVWKGSLRIITGNETVLTVNHKNRNEK
jgi:hypothetical protein